MSRTFHKVQKVLHNFRPQNVNSNLIVTCDSMIPLIFGFFSLIYVTVKSRDMFLHELY